METTKEEMMILLRELHDLQMWLIKIGSESVFAVVFDGSYLFSVTARVACDIGFITMNLKLAICAKKSGFCLT